MKKIIICSVFFASIFNAFGQKLLLESVFLDVTSKDHKMYAKISLRAFKHPYPKRSKHSISGDLLLDIKIKKNELAQGGFIMLKNLDRDVRYSFKNQKLVGVSVKNIIVLQKKNKQAWLLSLKGDIVVGEFLIRDEEVLDFVKSLKNFESKADRIQNMWQTMQKEWNFKEKSKRVSP